MLRTYDVYQIDAFTRELFQGNAAGVVPRAMGLSDPQMLKIANELRCSETAFVFPSEAKDHDIRIRFFTPTMEVPVCGHATIAAHYVRGLEEETPSAIIRQKTNAGIQEIAIAKDEEGIFVTIRQGKPTFGKLIEGEDRAKLLTALGITESELLSGAPIQVVSTGHAKVMIGIRSRDRLNKLQPDLSSLTGLSQIIDCNGYFVFTFDSRRPDVLTVGRMFAPAIGVNEDPVTGNANGPLGAYLVQHKLVPAQRSEFRFTGMQGEAISRKGFCTVVVSIDGGTPEHVTISGRAVVAFRTEIQV